MLTLDQIKSNAPNVYANEVLKSKISEWLAWYRGETKLHSYVQNNGITVRNRKLPTLRMAARVCEDLVATILSEDWGIEVVSNKGVKASKATSAFLQGSAGTTGVLGTTNFKGLFNDCLEYMFALGTSAITISLDNISTDADGNILPSSATKISFNSYIANEIYPITYRNGIIKEVAFTTEQTVDGETYNILTKYELDENNEYIISNIIYKGDEEVSAEKVGLVPYIRTRSSKPWFIILTTAKANKIDFNSPLGESAYSDAEDVLYSIDLTYSCIKQEVITGRRLVLFNKSLLTTDDQGNPIVPDDAMQNYFQFFSDEASNEVKDFVKEFHSTLNTDKLNEELQLQLNILSSKVGLGKKYYNLEDGTTVTATEVRAEEKTGSRNIKRQSLLIQQQLQQLLLAVIDIGANILGMGIDIDAKVSVNLRNTTTEDIEVERQHDLVLVDKGIMTPNEFRAKWLSALGNLPEETE